MTAGSAIRDLAVTQTVEPPDPTVQSNHFLNVLRYIQSQHIANVNKSPTRIAARPT
jgi:hypothetical protein